MRYAERLALAAFRLDGWNVAHLQAANFALFLLIPLAQARRLGVSFTRRLTALGA